jgi:predicted RNA-binding Zn-ribbon protein involved in translation (DUF1610 family)
MLPLINKLIGFDQSDESSEIVTSNEDDCTDLDNGRVANYTDKDEPIRDGSSAPVPQSYTNRFRCPDKNCQKGFTRNIDLVRHYGTRMPIFRRIGQSLTNHSGADWEFNSRCESCSKKFSKASVFIDHRCPSSTDVTLYRRQLRVLRKQIYQRLGIKSRPHRTKTRAGSVSKGFNPPSSAPAADNEVVPLWQNPLAEDTFETGYASTNCVSAESVNAQAGAHAVPFSSLYDPSFAAHSIEAPMWFTFFSSSNGHVSALAD